VNGLVVRVNVQQNQHVEAEATLFVIDPEPYQIAVDGARAQLGLARAQVESQVATYRSRQRQVEQAQASLTYAEQQLQRVEELLPRGAATQAQRDAARRDEDVARAALQSAQSEAQAALAQIGGNGDLPIERRPQYLAAEANLRTAERNLSLTTVRAPFAGIVTNVNAIDVGAFVAAGQQTISMVAVNQPWVETNLRETDLTHVRVGNPAEVEVDAFPGHIFRGRVESINPASGAVFSLIPPQNASGNWVKVVQRIPVRIHIERREDDPVLRNGMSATVRIDTGYQRTAGTLWRDIRSWF
jgi:membrane fusion protein (multidrug efflux system)